MIALYGLNKYLQSRRIKKKQLFNLPKPIICKLDKLPISVGTDSSLLLSMEGIKPGVRCNNIVVFVRLNKDLQAGTMNEQNLIQLTQHKCLQIQQITNLSWH